MKCAIYARVSTDEQETSIINQQEYFKDYIQRHNLEIFDIYSDEAFSGTESTKRLSFQRLLKDGKDKKYDILLAKSYSRFGRNQRETLSALAELFENGIRIIFVEDGLDSLRDKGQFGLFAWLAEQESRKISERIKTTWQLYNKQGKVHNTHETFGYNYNKTIRNFVVNEEEAEIVRLVFDMYLRGNGYSKISGFLNTNNISTKKYGNWHPSRINDIINNEFYLGHLQQGKTQTIDISIKKTEVFDKSKWITHKNHHEAIISEEIFQKTQLENKKRSAYRCQDYASRHSITHLFSNLIKCELCGHNVVAKKTKSGNNMTYACKAYLNWGVDGCGHRRNGILEETLIQYVKTELKTLAESNFADIREYYRKISSEKRTNKAKINISKIDEQIEAQTRLGSNLLSLYSEGFIGKEQFTLQNNPIAVKLNSLMELKEIALREQNINAVNIENEEDFIESIKIILDTDISAWTNEMMKKIISKINLNMRNDVVEILFKNAISSN